MNCAHSHMSASDDGIECMDREANILPHLSIFGSRTPSVKLFLVEIERSWLVAVSEMSTPAKQSGIQDYTIHETVLHLA